MDDLYESVGLYSTNDTEQAFAIVVTAMIVIHSGRTLATEQYHVRIVLHTHLSAIPIPHFSEVLMRLNTVLQPALMDF